MEQIFVLQEGKCVGNPRDLFEQAEQIQVNHDQENCIVFYLDNRHHVIEHEVLLQTLI